MLAKPVAFVGSRSLASPLVERIVDAVLETGRGVAVGCCVGVDAAVISSVLKADQASSLAIFAAFGQSGRGSCSLSAVGLVSRAAAAGSAVSWWAGGRGSLVYRLRGRSLAVAASGSELVAFVAPGSRGSWLAVRAAVSAGVPVVVFPVGSFALPSLGAGRWVVAGAGVWAQGFRWVSDQAELF